MLEKTKADICVTPQTSVTLVCHFFLPWPFFLKRLWLPISCYPNTECWHRRRGVATLAIVLCIDTHGCVSGLKAPCNVHRQKTTQMFIHDLCVCATYMNTYKKTKKHKRAILQQKNPAEFDICHNRGIKGPTKSWKLQSALLTRKSKDNWDGLEGDQRKYGTQRSEESKNQSKRERDTTSKQSKVDVRDSCRVDYPTCKTPRIRFGLDNLLEAEW